jgi:uncharacterized protein (TIGR02147 family)
MSNKKINIYTYNDYRVLLADYFKERRSKAVSFSIRNFARIAGIASHSFISAVIKGKRNLTADCKQKIAQGMGLTGNELLYFNHLVDFNQSRNVEEKQEYFKKLNTLRRNTKYYEINKTHFAYLSNWYNFVIRELAENAPWGGDYARLASYVLPVITESQARASVNLLIDTGLLVCAEDGTYHQTKEILTTKEIPGHLVKVARKQFIELSARASEEIAPHERNLASTTLALSSRNYQRAVEIMEEARKRIIALSQDKEPVNRVYQAHLHLFPLSKDINSAEEQ